MSSRPGLLRCGRPSGLAWCQNENAGSPLRCEQLKRMKTPHSTLFRYSAETIAHANRIPVGVVNEHSHKTGMTEGEPIIVMMDCLLKYAETYRERFEVNLADDQCLGEWWLDAAKAVRRLLNGDGVVAMKRGITTDSKDNGAVEGMFWDAVRIAGFDADAVQ